ncbi:hypothetical protein [Polyangium fumosum]|uniref:2'-5' RNA ligase family protein n=1 Tax=Polyangium fumosum TaxID=889272 RepID=A0A4U1IX73_9BACT|nr:hypothetical protein [Polyangium fumosum]TKC98636.1 hypothetical protein E8A74_40405 [Polyangium fumosum]
MHPDGYFALVLDPASAETLRRGFCTLPRPIAHHCTVRYGTKNPADLPPPFTANDLGRTFTLAVTGYARRDDGGIEAVVVGLLLDNGRLLEHGFTENAIPHVTVATDGIVEPATANDLLRAGFERIAGPLLLARLEHTWASSSREEPAGA